MIEPFNRYARDHWRLTRSLRPIYAVLASTIVVACIASCTLIANLNVARDNSTPITIARDLPVSELERSRIASGLANPRGILVEQDGSILVAEAGSGTAGEDERSAELVRLIDINHDGDFDDEDERAVLIDGLVSRNIFDIVQRDEVFGMAAVSRGDGIVLATHALFSGPSVVFKVDRGRVSPWATVHGNLNHLAYDSRRHQWLAVSSSSDELVRLNASGRGERVLKFSPLADGQDAVPGYLRFDPSDGTLLVSLFSGSPLGESGGDGTELVAGAGVIVRVDLDRTRVVPVVTGLTAPTDFLVDENGRIYILELCDSFVDGIHDRGQLASGVRHGGFRRFSGRLLRVDPRSGEVEVLARGLDTPTNLTRSGATLFISEGMGTPGRSIPGRDGVVELDGFIEALEIPH